MKLTPLDIHHKEFRTSLRGYNEKEVDAFLDEVADEFERLFKENVDLNERLQATLERIKSYEDMKETLQNTLIVAQKHAEDVGDRRLQARRADDPRGRPQGAADRRRRARREAAHPAGGPAHPQGRGAVPRGDGGAARAPPGGARRVEVPAGLPDRRGHRGDGRSVPSEVATRPPSEVPAIAPGPGHAGRRGAPARRREPAAARRRCRHRRPSPPRRRDSRRRRPMGAGSRRRAPDAGPRPAPRARRRSRRAAPRAAAPGAVRPPPAPGARSRRLGVEQSDARRGRASGRPGRRRGPALHGPGRVRAAALRRGAARPTTTSTSRRSTSRGAGRRARERRPARA